MFRDVSCVLFEAPGLRLCAGRGEVAHLLSLGGVTWLVEGSKQAKAFRSEWGELCELGCRQAVTRRTLLAEVADGIPAVPCTSSGDASSGRCVAATVSALAVLTNCQKLFGQHVY